MSSARRRFLRNASISSQSIVPAAKSMLNLRPGSTEYIQYDVSGLASGFEGDGDDDEGSEVPES
eukprot:CAMPEP_0206126750 /NCGR_PEP_ID=MMETSP1472-20131121/23738_1 /ASSEMBLY_ACC=CAM_ASM_001108 /TAXON_ID=41880 /ORGANISM="Pycnococcus provasolii, Strain RCC251" /LENGTH=63 /DNA_ID=CAMNT_0053517791 /DNA_START=84 /DNA_END=271 /DNA_ORIENTATION=+